MRVPPIHYSSTLYDALNFPHNRQKGHNREKIKLIQGLANSRNICFEYAGEFDSEDFPWTLQANMKISVINGDGSTHYYIGNYNEGVFDFVAMFDSEENSSSSLEARIIANHYWDQVKEPFLNAYRQSLH